MKLSLSNAPKKTPSVPRSAFSLDDDAPPMPSASSSKPFVSKSSMKLQQAAQASDSTVYQYDEIYDAMKDAQDKAKAALLKEKAEGKPKHIESLLKAAELRKKDRIRAEDKLMERERAAEGDEYDDKEAFVTQAYKEQQEELRRAEEEERLKEEQQGKKKGGMAAYMMNELDRKEALHSAIVNASLAATPSAPATDSPSQVTDEQRAAEASKLLGRTVVVNDQGEIVDKRELLSGGLNIAKKKTYGPAKPSHFAVPISQRAPEPKQEQAPLAIGPYGHLSAEERSRISRQRQSAMVQEQMLEVEAKKRKKEEEDAAEMARRVTSRRNDETKVEELKRLALERRAKRQRELEANPS